jgi:hypothetical protein
MRVFAVILAAFALGGCTDNTKFGTAAFRDAATRGDDDELNRQAYAAEREQALVGLPRARVYALLGRKPDEVWREVHTDAWAVGEVDDSMGPGDQGYLAVRYDRAWRRVVRVEVAF